MANRKIEFSNNEYYHVYNQTVEKRDLFEDEKDLNRFVESAKLFNTQKSITSIYANSFLKKDKKDDTEENRLINFIAYCINPNHYHFIIEQLVDDGVPKFMHKFSTGYTNYFNEKHERRGSLFGGRYKAKHIDSDNYLLHLSAYVNLNNMIHGIKETNDWNTTRSSWKQYTTNEPLNFKDIKCDTEIVIAQFKNKNEYERYAKETAEYIKNNRIKEKEDKYGLTTF